MSAYKDLDEAIVAHIKTRPGRHPIYSEDLTWIAASELGRATQWGDAQEWRLIDRRMQVLKEAGRIKYERPSRMWVVV